MKKSKFQQSALPPISRRDFIHGAGIALGSSLLTSAGVTASVYRDAAAAESSVLPAPYPPALQGLRGNHEGSQTYPHLLRDGKFDAASGQVRDSGEEYDLVVVGAGISGLSAAYFYRQQFGPGARILILDNHDDFGGHARRNEFTVDGRTLLSYGGTQAIDNPGKYRPSAKRLLAELGVSVTELGRNYSGETYKDLGSSCFFDAETFGKDRLVTGMNVRPWREFLAESPLSARVRADIERLYGTRVDYLKHLSAAGKRRLLAGISYAQYLTRHCGVVEDTLAFFRTYPHDLFGVGIDAVSALACYENPDDYDSFAYPGFDGLGFQPVEKEPYIYMFPDGNSSIARLLVRELVPGAVPGSSVAEVVGANTRYERLDVAGARVRVRLNSPVVGVEPRGGGVEVSYASGGSVDRVAGKHCILACYHSMMPYICPSLPGEQKEAMRYCVKAPFLYTHVALRNWRAFAQLGIRHIVAPGAYHSYTALAFPVSNGDYHCARDPSEPMVLFMMRAPCSPGLPRRDQHRAGRVELLATPFETIERNIRDQLQRMLGHAGFDGDRDIAGITVNRWAHGYAYEYDTLFDPEWPKGKAPNEIARRRHGSIAIANSDSAAAAYTDAAIDEAHRAVGDLRRGNARAV
jgi:spermidine dehydrogenase